MNNKTKKLFSCLCNCINVCTTLIIHTHFLPCLSIVIKMECPRDEEKRFYSSRFYSRVSVQLSFTRSRLFGIKPKGGRQRREQLTFVFPFCPPPSPHPPLPFFSHRLTWTSLRRKWKYQSRWRFPSGHGTSQTLGFERSQLLHEVRTLHKRNVCEVQVTEDVILETSRAFLIRPGQVEAARVAPETFLVVVIVIVQRWRFWNKQKKKKTWDGKVFEGTRDPADSWRLLSSCKRASAAAVAPTQTFPPGSDDGSRSSGF